jgi:hypothetical protein
MAKAGRPSVYKDRAKSVNLYLTESNLEYLERKAKEKGLASASALLNQILLALRKREAS